MNDTSKQVIAANEPRVPVQQSQEMTGLEASIDPVELLYRILYQWKLIACLALVGALIMGVYTIFFVTPLYSAQSTIYVLSNKDTVINMSDLQIGSALTSDYLKVFDMWEVHEKVIEKLGLSYNYTEMANMLSVSNDSNTRMLDIKVTSPKPKEAAEMANAYAEVVREYIADTMATDMPSIMSYARTPTKPVSPNRTRNIILGFLAGILVALVYITIRFLTDDKIKTSDDIMKYTGLVTLATIPVIEGMSAPGKDAGKLSKKHHTTKNRK